MAPPRHSHFSNEKQPASTTNFIKQRYQALKALAVLIKDLPKKEAIRANGSQRYIVFN